ncbi:hypothetical protein P4H65_06660 [Paenibacillus chitinolyticus]|uniref:hypothetical protein n=1 Tax=Paenibacillus chitinolyticus TaxID=79263 RepID=UPI002DBDA151|nr:hypothetical protein [Paenibacillus chitinolyticus]MEC0245474.1 hypothetical protein [Paenibacillus chitinolyticus]
MKRAIGSKRAAQLRQAATNSIGLTEGLTAAKIELRTLLEQYGLFSRQLEEIMMQVEALLAQIPVTFLDNLIRRVNWMLEYRRTIPRFIQRQRLENTSSKQFS